MNLYEIKALTAHNKINEVVADLSGIESELSNLATQKADNSRVDAIITTPVESVSAQEIIDARQGETNLGAKITKVGEQINDLATYTTPEMFNGASDCEKIQNALNDINVKNVVLKDKNYIIDENIVIPDNKGLILNNSSLTIIADTDGITLNNYSRLLGGTIFISPTINANYTKSAVVLTKPDAIIDGTSIINGNKQRYNMQTTGTGIEFRVNTKGAYICYAQLNNLKIQGFNIGIDITIPNIPPHVIGSGYDNWVTTCFIKGVIECSNQALRLDDQSNNGISIQGMDIMIRGQSGFKNPNFDEAIYANCTQSTFNVILDDAFYSPNHVTNFIVFGEKSSRNTYLGVDEKVVNNGTKNIIINNFDNYFRPEFLYMYNQTDAYNQGVINSLLFHANQRFTVTLTKENCEVYEPNDCFKFGKKANTEIWRTIQANEAIATYNINFGSTQILSDIVVTFKSFEKGDKIKFRAKSAGTWKETGLIPSREYNRCDIFRELGIDKPVGVIEIEVIIYMGANFTGTNVQLTGIYASGGAINQEHGGLLSKTGGQMYGNIVFETTSAGIIVKTPDGTKRYKIGVDNAGAITTTLIP